jgi:hypothetical protein
VPVPHTPDDRHLRALLILLLLAREAALTPEQVDGPEARALVGRSLARDAARAHRATVAAHVARPWMCRYRWAV